MTNFLKKYKLIFVFIIFLNILLSAWYVINKDLMFHTDIARDFLVLEDIVRTHKPTLLGPRSGGIPGVFHGPLWFYVNLPIFILGKGNPVVVGWFWVFLSALSIFATYYFGKKLFGEETGLLASLLLSVFSISYTNNLFNPFGAVLLFPIFFYLLITYVKSAKFIYLIVALFLLGLIIQFQIAFGLPILVLLTIYLIPFFFKKKKLSHIFAYFILLIPLSTYFLFELRHNFLQIRSVISYITTKQSVGSLSMLNIFIQRARGILFDGINIIPQNYLLNFPVTILFAILIYKLKDKKFKYRNIYYLYFFFYFGFWILTLAFKGVVWGYYYWPFLPLTLIIFTSLFSKINKKIFALIFIYIFVINFISGIQAIKSAGTGWRFNYELAKKIYKDADGSDFGYYIYTPDQFAYSEKYSILYVQNIFGQTVSHPYEKKALTYLIIAPPPEDKPYLKGDWWKSNQVKINRNPDKVFKYSNNMIVEKYLLSKEELKIPSDPNLIQDLIFR
ncbi:MAG: glycosyltransferase family 39 protein [Patescibacteria group bacterium]